ncbi:hypothetical protein [uncultured Agrococcus sp.]|uniref:hypothetical protein n=1 Tax=uncultured Agrococcus sp. TaxID=382258 RepID=UPI0025E02145|nr:hypothetical protein [uncultured Agrococcus sp.]
MGTDAVDPAILKRSSLSRIDYVDHFALTPFDATNASAERWARTMFGDVPTAAERFIWKGLLRLRLRRGRSSTTVAGWLISEKSQSWIRLQAASAALTANLILHATEDSLSLTTLLTYERARGSMVWRPLSSVHRRLSPGILRDAVSELSVDDADAQDQSGRS